MQKVTGDIATLFGDKFVKPWNRCAQPELVQLTKPIFPIKKYCKGKKKR